MRDPLDIWIYGTRIATLSEAYDGRLALSWTDESQERWPEGTRLLSAKLTIGDVPVPALVKNYLDGLLPEGNARTNHAMSAGVPPDDSFAMIRSYGRDTTGAAIFVTEGADDPTAKGRYVPLTQDQLADRIRHADEHAPAGAFGTTVESVSLPGMVPKIAAHHEDGIWFACKDGAPSTWIIKRGGPAESAIADVVDTEVASLTLARMLGLTSVDAKVLEFEDVRAIAVSRYDRDLDGPHPRIHQEDLAQAIGLNTLDPNRKFQWGSRLPSLRHAADVIRLDGGNPDDLLRLATFSHLIGNTDMHAKNISFIRRVDGSVTLSPAYDISMHLHHRRDNRRFALDVNGKFVVSDVTADDLVAEGRSWGLPERRARLVVDTIVADLAEALADIDRSAHPGVSAEAWAVVDERVAAAS
ncbi:HipA domain-containing protein [Nocardioides panzhihuensis]|uniref:Serine/threonine-protein kinase HipA n=1 Tax=Nocardioides panzhihuensis TaxID=860243 RepID=A0A7Z0DPN7_9ACTN|nr:HipA domain-containing protein [Nocardioides panzhihuensis]NYI79480.1 serine/threonine-protein kinase HipA [Nocardioides panzhihuensis]